MRVTVEPKPPAELLPTGIVQQTAFWSRVKESLGWSAGAFDLEPAQDSGAGDMLVVGRGVSERASIAYVPFGPEYRPDEDARGSFLEGLSERLKAFLPRGCIFIRFELPWESPYAREESRYDAEGQWLGAPEPEARELRMNFGTERRALRKAPTDLMPPDTVIVDLRPPEDEILGRMKPKTRYNIGLAARRGVLIEDAGPAGLEAWYALYAQTAARNGFVLHDRSHFAAVLAEGENGRRGGPRETARLLIARRGGKPLAGMILALSGPRATYLYGASSGDGREAMASYALQWAAMRLAKASGALEYDLFGCSPRPDPEHPLYGLWRFKTGFGGELVHRQGCWDYPLDPSAYELWRAHEATSQGFHL